MDQFEFSRKLRSLAGADEHDFQVSEMELAGILGRLGFARTVRRLQALALGCGLCLLALASMRVLSVTGTLGLSALALIHAFVCMSVVVKFPYWTPPTALREGLLALARYTLNDRERFIANQRTPLTVVNNTMLGDLCKQLVLDQRRKKISNVTEGGTDQ